ncbi:MAG: FAD-binding dehydrogenase [Planctomycetes bacterium]|nr:FAD-binding dehydrogenase [Planctomycetota bacterium]
MADEADAIVVGGGLAGLATAIELLDNGQSVLLLERNEPAALGGLALWSFGGFFFVDTPVQRAMGIRDSVCLALRDWHAVAEFGPEDELPRQWAEQYVQRCRDDVFAWLGRCRVRFPSPVFWLERGLFTPGNSVPRFHMVRGIGSRLIEAVLGRLNDHPLRGKLRLLYRHRVDRLLTAGGRVCGCAGTDESTGRLFTFHAPNTIVASGGITGDLERVRRHWYRPWGAPPQTLLNGSHEAADGRLHDAVETLGGRLTHLDKMWNYATGVHHPQPRHPHHGLSIVPPKTALWVNAEGRRIGPLPLLGGFDTRSLVERICQEEHKYSWQVLNYKIAVRELALSGTEFNETLVRPNWLRLLRMVLFGNRGLVDLLARRCRDVVTADSLEELVARMNALDNEVPVRLDLLRKEVEAFDAMISRKASLHNDDQLRRIAHLRQYPADRFRTCRPRPILDRSALPLIAIREFILTRKSLGGIQTDLHCRVLDQGGAAIPGLYAVGEAAGFGGGGIHGLRSLEGTFLGCCILTGRIAARSVARG